MLSRIFPRQADNRFGGHWLAVVLFVLVTLVKGAQGVATLADARGIAEGADGIPLGTYSAAAADTVVALFALLGFYLLIVASLGVVVVLRYRALIPVMFVVWLAVQLGHRAVLAVNPIERVVAEGAISFAGQPVGFWVNLAILAATIIGLLLSLRAGKNHQTPESAILRETGAG
jgi:hypothetical protein